MDLGGGALSPVAMDGNCAEALRMKEGGDRVVKGMLSSVGEVVRVAKLSSSSISSTISSWSHSVDLLVLVSTAAGASSPSRNLLKASGEMSRDRELAAEGAALRARAGAELGSSVVMSASQSASVRADPLPSRLDGLMVPNILRADVVHFAPGDNERADLLRMS